MIDQKTIDTYQLRSSEFIERYLFCSPKRLHDLAMQYFIASGTTLDLGCASGRDLDFLLHHGFKVEGMDIVSGFVEHCRNKFPHLVIHQDSLPYIKSLQNGRYDNLLLCAVLMHIPQSDISVAIKNCMRILKTGGRILLSVKRPQKAEIEFMREEDGRLVTVLNDGHLQEEFGKHGASLLHLETEKIDDSMLWATMIFAKN